MKAEEIIKETKKDILEQLRDKLKDCNNDEVYFHDIVSEEIDSNTPQNRQECLNLIDLSNPENFDKGLIDNSSLDRTLITMAYCSLEENIFNDDFFQELQHDLNNEDISKKKAKEILNKINNVLEKEKKIFKQVRIKDTSTQVFINTSFSIGSLTKEDFIKYGLIEQQILDLSDSIKILTSNKNLNQNAIVITEKKRNVEKAIYQFRIYLMEKNKEIDIRNFFKLKTISEETGFNLSPSAYIEQTTEQYEEDKKSFGNNKRKYLTAFKDKTLFIKTIVEMSGKLTGTSINGTPKNSKAIKFKIVNCD